MVVAAVYRNFSAISATNVKVTAESCPIGPGLVGGHLPTKQPATGTPKLCDRKNVLSSPQDKLEPSESSGFL